MQFNFAKDLGLIKIIGYNSEGDPITSRKRLANTTLIFYIGYLGQLLPAVRISNNNSTGAGSAYPAALLTQRLPTGKVCAGAIFIWSVVILCYPACTNYGQLMVNWFFLGYIESFIAPAFVVYITFWWTR